MANEKRLIDANAFLNEIKERHDDIMQDPIVDKATKWRESVCFGGVVNVLVKMPTVDAVVVTDPELLKAIKLLIKQYGHSKQSEYVHSPVAHALFHTWKQVDNGR